MLNLTPEQVEVLRMIQAVEMGKKLDIRWENIADDEDNKRKLIYQDGNLDMLKYLLTFDERAAAQKEAEKQELLQKQAGQNPTDSQPFDFNGD